MKTSRFRFCSRPWRPDGGPTLRWAVCLLAGWAWFPAPTGNEARAFPPAPHHLVYGLVRDEFGNPFHIPGATVLLEAEGGSTVTAEVAPGLTPGVNYRLEIPLDSGASANLYKPTALRPAVPFRMRVRVGSVTWLPVEMTGTAGLLTRPAEATRVDLTLGVDSDEDGLPDTWELALIQALEGDGVQRTLADIGPDDDTDGDGLTNRDEYLAGTYAFDPKDGFALEIVEVRDARSLLEFTAVRGRSYTLHGSPDMKTWAQRKFQLDSVPEDPDEHTFYHASQVRRLRIWANPDEEGQAAARFFRIRIQ